MALTKKKVVEEADDGRRRGRNISRRDQTWSGLTALQGLEAPNLDDEKTESARQHLPGEYDSNGGSNQAQVSVGGGERGTTLKAHRIR